jgi:hypothetical protein
MMNEDIVVNNGDKRKWNIYFTEIKIIVGQETMMHAAYAQSLIGH